MFADLKQNEKPETPKQCATRHGTAIDEISGISIVVLIVAESHGNSAARIHHRRVIDAANYSA
jgi:hypothetical protein